MPSVLTVAIVWLSLGVFAWGEPTVDSLIFKDPVCEQIGKAISDASDVYYAGHPLYHKGIQHWASSSTQLSKCVVEPGSAEDVGLILQILGSTKTRFAVKGGGHTTNPGFSSTPGVHISMYRFSEINYSANTNTVVVGAGLIWDDVYAALESHGVNVVGGRVSGVGVAGFTLGGGYSWKSNQYGLTVDTVLQYELVKPSGELETVTASSNPDLFFSLKGGFNNYGIVTRFTLKTFPQTKVWGGTLLYTGLSLAEVNAATAKFALEVKDKKASIITTYNSILGLPTVAQLLFYDAPTPPKGIFDDFLRIPALTRDVQTRSYLSLVKSAPANITTGGRAFFDTVSFHQTTPALLDAVVNETVYWGTRLGLKSGYFFSYDVEPFLFNTYLAPQTSASAYPPSRADNIQPLNLYWVWTLEAFDDDFHSAIQQSTQRLRQIGGQNAAEGSRYPNYAVSGTSLENMYGAENLVKMRAVRKLVDPNRVMDLCGGFKV